VAGRRVLITGVGSFFGTELARRLEADPEFERIAGLDTRPPRAPLVRTEFAEADVRDVDLARRLPGIRADTVVHNQIVRQPGGGISPRAAHEINVIGTLQLLAACERAPGLRAIVVRGSAGIYGAEPGGPEFFTEDQAGLRPARTRFQRDVAEIDAYFEAFSRRHPGITCTMLRYQPAIGPTVDSQITRYLSLPFPPTYLGFDPRIQLVHEHDALEALVAAVKRPVTGAVNVASPGTIGLTRLLRLAGKRTVPLPHPLFTPAVRIAERGGLGKLSPDLRRLLRHGRAVDTRRLVEEVGFRPRFSTEEALRDHVRALRAPGRASSAPRLVPDAAPAG
jgi:UDP-glucose 4-epimerase